ncbi:MAG: peptidoglycan-binding protein [Peptococcaceae bacterium BRH_c4a]|nr:MAG: peptidoglycan-binding protein [Peptococcaceae bacterium BRH_c4a]
MVGTVAPGTERLRVNQVVSENTAQTVVRGTVTVPDPKPDVEKVLSTEKSAKVRSVEIVPDKVIVNGALSLQIVYVAFEPAQSVHSMHQTINFTTFVDVPGALPGMDVDVDVTVEDITVTRQANHPRRFDVAAVLEVSARVSDVMDLDVVTQCPAGCTCETEEVTVDQLMGSNRRQVMISDEFDVPDEKPPVEKVLDTDVKVETTNTRVLKNKVIVEGAATVTVTYVGMLPDQPVHSLHRTFKFSDFVDVPGAAQGMNVRVDIRVENVDVDVSNAKCDRLRVDMVLGITANVVEPRTVQVITELSNCPNVNPTFTDLKVESLVGENTSQVILKDTFETPDPKPDVEKILDTTADKVTVTETRIINDKVIVTGNIDVQIVYVAAEPDQSVHALHRRLPFRTFVEVMGAREDDDVDVTARVEFVTSSAKGCEITVEAVVKVTARVTQTLERQVLTSVAPVPTTVSPATTTPCPPGSTFEYIVKQGDTLYSIGRKYGVSLNEMKAANPQLPDPNNIKVGMVINVPCVAMG